MPSFHGHAEFELKARDHRRNEVSRACKICMLSQVGYHICSTKIRFMWIMFHKFASKHTF